MEIWLSQYCGNWQEGTISVQQRKYDSDFKRNAVRLTEDLDRIVKEIATNLGISKDILCKWHRIDGNYWLSSNIYVAFDGHENLSIK